MVKPLFKYIGGKSWLRDTLRLEIKKLLDSRQFTSYAEPFAGGLGSFLSVYDILAEYGVEEIRLSDVNEVLINTYNFIKLRPEEFVAAYLAIESGFVATLGPIDTKDKAELKVILKPAENYFNSVKRDFNQHKNNCDIVESARLVFLQKHSFNGIYRENSKGQYNTPFNWSPAHMTESIKDRVLQLSAVFQNVQFTAQSCFDVTYDRNCLYYLDPPYANLDTSENKYHKDQFDMSAQTTLINMIGHTTFLYSNHKSPELLEEFAKLGGAEITEIARKNIMSSKVSTRSEDKTEILVTHL